MSKIRERMIGAGVTVVVAGAAFWAGAAANAQEPAPVADQQATIATLTARLDVVEDTLASHGSRLSTVENDINNTSWGILANHALLEIRVWALEHP